MSSTNLKPVYDAETPKRKEVTQYQELPSYSHTCAVHTHDNTHTTATTNATHTQHTDIGAHNTHIHTALIINNTLPYNLCSHYNMTFLV